MILLLFQSSLFAGLHDLPLLLLLRVLIIIYYIITQVVLAFWLVLAYDLFLVFTQVMRRPCWCTKQWQNVAQVLHNNIIKVPKDFFRCCSVHQYGRSDVTWKPRIKGQTHRWRQRSIQTFFLSCVILWTNHNSLLSMATNHFASFCIDNRSRQRAIFVSVQVAKLEIKRLFFRIF